MKSHPLFKYLYIDVFSATPKYLQLANSIVTAISVGKLQQDDILPSINELSAEFEISRHTVEKTYKYLKNIGVLGAVLGKGYYVSKTDFRQPYHIFLLFNKLSSHKKIIYDSLIQALGNKANISFYIYNNDFALFKKLITGNYDQYTHFVIIPHFTENDDKAPEVINAIPKDKLILLDKRIPCITGEFGAVYESFEEDIYHALKKALPELEKYDTLKIIFPENSYYPVEILKGYYKFCQDYAFDYKVVHDILNEPIQKKEAYINVMEDDLITLIEKIQATELQIGHDIGIISYNETPLKKLILNGITTISTDFEQMGRITADLILSNSRKHVSVPFQINLRASL